MFSLVTVGETSEKQQKMLTEITMTTCSLVSICPRRYYEWSQLVFLGPTMQMRQERENDKSLILMFHLHEFML